MRRMTRVCTAIVFLVAAACGGSDSTGPGTTTTANPNDPMSATIDGVAWSSPVPSGRFNNSIVAVAGLDLGLTASVSFGLFASAPGTYSVGPNNTNFASAVVTKGGSAGWGSTFAGGSGSVTITTLTSNHMVGTFSFDAGPSTGGATGVVHVTNGKFNITF
jgi:hypothetical protein